MKLFKLFANGQHEYDIVVEDTDVGTKYSLYYSKLKRWTYSEELIIYAIDDGNKIKFSEKIGKELDYNMFCIMKLLLNFITKQDKTMMYEYEVIPVDKTAFVI